MVFATMAMAQNPLYSGGGTGIQGIDKLGGHQNGGRGCVGCHAPHSGGRGNGGVMKWDASANAGAGAYVAAAYGTAVMGDEVLWGQDLEPIYGKALNFPTTEGGVGTITITEASSERLKTGVAMCLSCHDGNVAKGAMMANDSFERTAGLLPVGLYGGNSIPTLLGADGGSYGNYGNDHPVGPNASLGAVGHGAIAAAKNFFALDKTVPATPVLIKGTAFAGSTMEKFYNNYGLPTIIDARAGAGWAIDPTATSVDQAYVVCTTCHTPHSMYTTSMQAPGAKGIDPVTSKAYPSKTYPTYFFVAAPYNPAAPTANGTKASSATQFCRQCHFSGPGGANEASGISIPTAF